MRLKSRSSEVVLLEEVRGEDPLLASPSILAGCPGLLAMSLQPLLCHHGPSFVLPLTRMQWFHGALESQDDGRCLLRHS